MVSTCAFPEEHSQAQNLLQTYLDLLSDCVKDFARAEETARRLHKVIKAVELDRNEHTVAPQALEVLSSLLASWKVSSTAALLAARADLERPC